MSILAKEIPIIKNSWKDINNHRKFLDDVAVKLNINKVDDWYRVKRSDLLKYKGGASLLTSYNGSIRRALVNVYPNYDWDFSKY